MLVINFKSQKQKNMIKHAISRGDKILHQWNDGSISVLHSFKVNNEIYEYVIIYGPRGGKKAFIDGKLR